MGFSDKMARGKLNEQAEQQTEERLGKTCRDSEAKLEKLEKKKPRALGRMWGTIKSMGSMTKAYAKGDYREVPWKIMSAVGGALAYFVMPVDLVPDFLVTMGYLDDAAVLKLAADLASEDLEDFKVWHETSQAIETAIEDAMDGESVTY
ncbi:YkvA family protein [Neptuniibacter sp. QD37_11]|uniref:YkvA family protein n=1 Tax=Neptuniibacter sp. QD37_11 TaxID=3398209 RepID=UPI0039F4F0FC